jgi:hypothetical protein
MHPTTLLEELSSDEDDSSGFILDELISDEEDSANFTLDELISDEDDFAILLLDSTGLSELDDSSGIFELEDSSVLVELEEPSFFIELDDSSSVTELDTPEPSSPQDDRKKANKKIGPMNLTSGIAFILPILQVPVFHFFCIAFQNSFWTFR